MDADLVDRFARRGGWRKFLVYTALVLLVGSISLTGLNGSLQNLDESLYANISRETLEAGSVIPLKQGRYYIHKSPMVFWTAILSFKAFGINDVAAKLPSALANVVSALVVFSLARRLYGSFVTGGMASFIFLTSLQVYASSHQLATDSLMVMSLMVGLIFALRGLEDNPLWLLPGGVFFGLGFLSKSIMGLVVPVTVLLSIAVRRRWRLLPLLAAAFLLGCAVAFPYYFTVYRRDPHGFAEAFLRGNIAGRIGMTASIGRFLEVFSHAGVYLAYCFLFLLPFSPGFFLLIRRRPHAGAKALLWSNGRNVVLLFFLVVLAGFSLASNWGTLPHYTFAMIAALAILLAGTLRAGTDRRLIYLILASLAFIAISFVVIYYLREGDKYPAYRDAIAALTLVYLLFIALSVLLYVKNARPRTGIPLLTLAFFVTFTAGAAVTVPLDFNADIKSFRSVVTDTRAPLIFVNTRAVDEGKVKARATIWYLGMDAVQYGSVESFAAQGGDLAPTTHIIFYRGEEREIRRIVPSLAVLRRGRIWSIGVVR
jgi:4-amino-4-deoxy-L-arabinose transferase-like glycosyltransferase